MSKLKFNPKLIICQYFDKITNLIDIHNEEQLRKYSENDLIGESFQYEFEELPEYWNYFHLMENSVFKFQGSHPLEKVHNELATLILANIQR